MKLLNTYEEKMSPVRDQFDQSPITAKMLDENVSRKALERFLIEYCARGIKITEPVDSWITRAGQRCQEVGLAETGDSLIKHAKHEAGHHLMFIDDVKFLVEKWNAQYDEKLDAEALMNQSLLKSAQEYIDLHEDTIKSENPYAQVAIEYEIEALSTRVGPKFLSQVQEVLGEEYLKGLTFLTEHVEIDVWHTELNGEMLGKLLEKNPEFLDTLTDTGSKALNIYNDFFNECWVGEAA